MAKKRKKTRTVTARCVGVILHQGGSGVLWKLRLAATHFPFYLDSHLSFTRKEDAEKEEKKWRGRKVEIRVTK